MNGLWVWLAVVVGKGRAVYTHENGKKRIAHQVIPRASEAPGGKPRGFASMKRVIKTFIKPKSFLVFDGWKSTKKAVVRLGYKHAPCHSCQLLERHGDGVPHERC